jgi:hypothetical protein
MAVDPDKLGRALFAASPPGRLEELRAFVATLPQDDPFALKMTDCLENASDMIQRGLGGKAHWWMDKIGFIEAERMEFEQFSRRSKAGTARAEELRQEVDKHHQTIVSRAREMLAQGVPGREIAGRLEQRGIIKPDGGTYSVRQIRRIIRKADIC